MFGALASRVAVSCVVLLVLTGCSLDERTLYESPPNSEGALGRGGASPDGITSTGEAGQASQPGVPSNQPCPDLDANHRGDCAETLVANPGFDEGADGWQADPNVTFFWSASEAEASEASGVLTVENRSIVESGTGPVTSGVGTCLSASEGETYLFLAQVHVPREEVQGAGGVSLWFYSEPDCQGGAHAPRTPLLGATPGWAVAQLKAEAPASTQSMRARLVVSKPVTEPNFRVTFDNILLRAE